ncbi:hypothetical protein LZ318_28785 [Saccharopolyspora indica]|uniref:hypothetical protein n=1 Tax=Saccharopolyspora indica TaxID=1229659 RepID=UPI0022EAB1D6|nr:hypothetical protein [Saccharopolyspora indica]MDA3646319.1 hypothetical protein [Saccharopolyspora indica]
MTALITEGFGYFTAPAKEVQSQRAVDEAKDRELGARPAALARVRALPAQFNVDGWSWMFSEALPRERTDAMGRTFVDGVNAAGQGAYAGSTDNPVDPIVREAGGIRAAQHCPEDCRGASRYKISLAGNRREPITIVDMRARIVGEKPAIGTLLWSPMQGGEPLEEVLIDLDSTDLSPQKVSPETGTSQPYLDTANLTLEQHEQIGFEVTAMSARRWLLWELVVTAADRTGEHEIVIRSDGTAGGAPFETIGWNTGGASSQRQGQHPTPDGEGRGGFLAFDMAGGWSR